MTHPLVFLRMALMTSFTPLLICFRLAAFFASLKTCMQLETSIQLQPAQLLHAFLYICRN